MTYALALQAISDPKRRLLLERLKNSPLNVGDLAAGLPISRPAVSRHLGILHEGGLVSFQQHGTSRIYSIDLTGLSFVREWLHNFSEH